MSAFTGMNLGLGALPLLSTARTRSISPENPTGEKGKGGMAIPNPEDPALVQLCWIYNYLFIKIFT